MQTTPAHLLKNMEREHAQITRTLQYDNAHFAVSDEVALAGFAREVQADAERQEFLARRIVAMRRQLGIVG